MTMPHIKIALISFCSLHILSCAQKPAPVTSAVPPPDAPPVFEQSLKGYMAELGQCMSDVYRFWDRDSMRELTLQRLDRMLEIHSQLLEIYPSYLEQHSIEAYRNQQDAFEQYLKQSRSLTQNLKEAVLRQNPTEIEQAFTKLDQNRRNAHSAFGQAL